MKYAGKIGAKYSIVIGGNEIDEGEITIKNMESGETVTAALSAEAIKTAIGG